MGTKLEDCTNLCEDVQCQLSSMSVHSISKTEFDTLTSNFSSEGKYYDVEDVVDIIFDENVTCTDYVYFGGLDFQDPSNKDIDLRVGSQSQRPNITFSILLFKGILNLIYPESFEFFKARTQNDDTICFKTITHDAHDNELSLYWDVSDAIP
jgi:hypothetical protein